MQHQALPAESRRDPVVGQLAPTREDAFDSLVLHAEQLGISGLLKVRDFAHRVLAEQQVEEDKQRG